MYSADKNHKQNRINNLSRLLFSRIIQLFGNIVKIICIGHYKLFPSSRFLIPYYSPPLLKLLSTKKIPRIIWQTNYTNKVTLSVYLNYCWNRLFTPTFEYRFSTDDLCQKQVHEAFSGEIKNTYDRLQIGAAKADFWRVLMIIKYGGIYLDLDATLCWFPEIFLASSQEDLFIKIHDGRVTNYFFAASPDYHFLLKAAEKIVHNIKDNQLTSVFDMTGPLVFEELASKEEIEIQNSRLICRQGVFTNKYLQYANDKSKYWGNEQKTKSIVKQ